MEGHRGGQDGTGSARSEHAPWHGASERYGRTGAGRRTRGVWHRIWRLVVGLVGGAITVTGLILVPLPGPGWLIVFVGLAVLASEFEWAQRLLDFARDKVAAWTRWLGRQSLVLRGAVALATCGFVLAVVYVMLRVGGVPGPVPDQWVAWVPGLAGAATGR